MQPTPNPSNIDIFDICLLCLDDLSPPLQKPSSCNCNVSLHKKCMEEIQQNGLLCPICRIKSWHQTQTQTQTRYNILTQLSPFALFIERPNALTFFIFFIWCAIALCVACVVFVGLSILCLACFICVEIPRRLFSGREEEEIVN